MKAKEMEREKVTKSVPSGAERDKGTFPFRNGFLCLLSLLLPHLVCMSQRFFDNERGKNDEKDQKVSEGVSSEGVNVKKYHTQFL